MKTTALCVLLASLVVASPLSAQSISEKTGVNSALGVAPKTSDFIKEAAISDIVEIESANIAMDKGNADEKKFAKQMIDDHTKTSAELKALVAKANLTAELPTVLDDSSKKKLDKLRETKSEDFSSEYDPMQVSAHKDAVSLFERYSKNADSPELKDWAGKTLPHLQHHLEMAQALDKNRK